MRRIAENRASHTNCSDSYADGEIQGVKIGKIVRFDEVGRVLVDFTGNHRGPVVARVASSANEKLRDRSFAGLEVLLVFEDGDPQRPIITDTIYSLLDDIAERSDMVLEGQAPEEVSVDHKRMVFDAEDEIVLRCGDASITLTRAGKVVIKGKYLLSRSSGANRIKGGSVQIN